MKGLIIWLEIIGLALALYTLLFPQALTIFIFMTVGNFCILAGLALYLIWVIKDLRKHRVL